LKDLLENMTQPNFTARKNCEEILKNSNLWSMRTNEPKDYYKLIKTTLFLPKPYSFVYHMIESKLNSNRDNSVNSTIGTAIEKK
jgi:hypothetical protein